MVAQKSLDTTDTMLNGRLFDCLKLSVCPPSAVPILSKSFGKLAYTVSQSCLLSHVRPSIVKHRVSSNFCTFLYIVDL